MRCEEAEELITALIDDELSGSERSSIETHLRDCPRCQLLYREERILKTETSMAGLRVHAPAELRQKILSDPRFSPGRLEPPRGLFWVIRPALQPAFVLALLVLLILPAFYLMQPEKRSLSLSALETHRKITQGSLYFVRTQSQQAVKEDLMKSVGGSFGPMGYDLSMLGLQPVGGIVREVRGRKVLVAVYEGQGLSLTCYTFLGTEEDAPAGAALSFDAEKKINFYTFSRGDINAVLHREGKLICILVSTVPMHELLALARSKAQAS